MITFGQRSNDRRVRIARLTEAGRMGLAAESRRSDLRAGAILATLNNFQYERLVGVRRASAGVVVARGDDVAGQIWLNS